MAHLYIIAGCNGAGKTTASYSVLPDILNCKEFVNADEIARGLSPFQPEKVAIDAGRIMLGRIRELINQNTDFAFETTLATKSYAKLIQEVQTKGYFVTLLFFWLKTPEMAINRVKNRVMLGGHNIKEEVIYRRYYAGIANLSKLYIPVCDYWMIIDNSKSPFQIVAEGNKSENINVINQQIYNQITS